jgi:hypothetical protein
VPYRDNISEEHWLKLKAAVEKTGRNGPFDANDAMQQFIAVEWEAGNIRMEVPFMNAGDVGLILRDMVDLGYLRELGGNPPRWELVRD